MMYEHKDPRFEHPLRDKANPLVAEVYYHLAVALHLQRAAENLHADEITRQVHAESARLRTRTWDEMLRLAHLADNAQEPTWQVPLTEAIPEWAEADDNARYATHDGLFVLFRDYEYDQKRGREVRVWNIGAYFDEDIHWARVYTLDQARAVIAPHYAHNQDAHVRRHHYALGSVA